MCLCGRITRYRCLRRWLWVARALHPTTLNTTMPPVSMTAPTTRITMATQTTTSSTRAHPAACSTWSNASPAWTRASSHRRRRRRSLATTAQEARCTKRAGDRDRRTCPRTCWRPRITRFRITGARQSSWRWNSPRGHTTSTPCARASSS